MNQNNIVDIIDVEQRHYKIIKEILAKFLPYKKVLAYGSRVKWNSSETSDLDLAVFNATQKEIYEAKEAFDESNIPFIIQILNWETIQQDFKENIEQKYNILQKEDDWGIFKLGDVVEVIIDNRGRNPKHYCKRGIPVIDNFMIKNDKFPNLEDAKRFLDERTYKTFIRKFTNHKDVLITLVGNGYGNVTQSPYKESAIIQNTVGLRGGAKLNNDFLFYNLKFNNEEILNLDRGAVQPSIKVGDLMDLEISLPALKEQKAIAEILSSLDDKIDLLHRQNKTLENLAETLFRHYFIDNDKDDWKVGKLGDIISVIESGSRPKGGIDPDLTCGIASIGAESIKGIGNFNFSATKFIKYEFFSKMKKGKVYDKDVLIYKDGAYIGRKGMFGRGFPFQEFAVNEHVFILRANELSSQYFLYFALDEEELRCLNTNSAQPGLNQASMRSFEIVIPPKLMITKFDKEVEPLVDKILYNAKQIQTLEKLRDTLLPKLISGAIRVNYKENE